MLFWACTFFDPETDRTRDLSFNGQYPFRRRSWGMRALDSAGPTHGLAGSINT